MVGLLLGPTCGDVGGQKDVIMPKPVERSMSFRLGSGVVATGLYDITMDWAAPTKMTLLKSERSPAGKTLLPTPGKNHDPIPIYMKMNQNIV